jgi:hypothetical protein
VAECELSMLTRQYLNWRIGDREILAREVQAWEAERNAGPVTIDWQFTAADARIRLKRLYPVIKEQNSIYALAPCPGSAGRLRRQLSTISISSASGPSIRPVLIA